MRVKTDHELAVEKIREIDNRLPIDVRFDILFDYGLIDLDDIVFRACYTVSTKRNHGGPDEVIEIRQTYTADVSVQDLKLFLDTPNDTIALEVMLALGVTMSRIVRESLELRVEEQELK